MKNVLVRLSLVMLPSIAACAEAAPTHEVDPDPAPTTAPLDGVELVDVELNPGVAMPLLHDGTSVPIDMTLPRGRDAVLRVDAQLPADAVGTEVIARALLDGADATVIEVEDTVLATEARTVFEIPMPGEAAQPGLAVSFEFRHTVDAADPGPDAMPEEGSPLPATPIDVPVDAVEGRINVVIVPVDYRGETCNAKVEVDEALAQRLSDALYEVNPVAAVELSVGEPLVFDGDLSTIAGMSQLLAASIMRRAEDDPAPEVYHYTLFDNCGVCLSYEEGGPCKVGTAAAIVQPTELDGRFRVALGQLEPPDRTTEWTFVHEMGHLQGRHHVFCPTQDAGNTDGQFPHPDGLIGRRGYGVRGSGWYDPASTHDYMSYCHDTWVSDYTWQATRERIQLLTSWENG